ncbi:MAG: Gx transporter family protein [Lachnospiraceae bacterium]|jgi:heptaprenyl diphosphate synthase|nr:Gx transporter family protein [Lachnospiraceae bacterium]
MNDRKRNAGRRVALYGMLIALAFVFSYVEAMIPLPVFVPGMKLGLANLVSVAGLYSVGLAGTALVAMVRIVLVGFTFGNTFSMLYGLAGGTASMAVMILARKSGWFSPVGVSILGGIFHNAGQLIIAAFVVRTTGVFVYFPALLASGVVTGTVIGLLGGWIVERIRPMIRQ